LCLNPNFPCEATPVAGKPHFGTVGVPPMNDKHKR